MKKWIYSILMMVALGCIEPINIKTDGPANILVVDGLITDQPGPYTIKLSRSIPYDNSKPQKVYSVPEAGAQLTIVDNLGNVVTALESGTPGLYQTNVAFLGIVGRTYQLKIQTFKGIKYTSAPEPLLQVPPISRIEQKYNLSQSSYINTNGQARVLKLEVFNIYVFVDDPVGVSNNYRWQVDGIFEFFSINDRSDIKQCWAPQTRLESLVQVANDENSDGRQFNKFIANVMYDRITNYLVKVRQYSLSPGAYKYWNGLSTQQTSTGSLFDPPPASIMGNMSNEVDPSETVFGYFGASSVAKSQLLFDRWKASNLVTPSRYIPARPGDCRTMEPGATNIKPEGF